MVISELIITYIRVDRAGCPTVLAILHFTT